MKDLKLVGLKSHDCHTLMQQLLPVVIRGVLPKHVRNAITRFCFFFNVLCNKVIDASKLDNVQTEIVTTLCLLEKYFPPSFFDIMVHLTVHLVREVKLCGPVWYRWMFPFERYMRTLKGYVRNRNRPEGCMAECYIAEEAVEFCSEFLSNMNTIGIPSKHRETMLTKSLSCANVHVCCHEEWEQAHRYVLENDTEVDPYIREHMTHLKQKYPMKGAKWLQDKHHRSFISWFHEHVTNTTSSSSNQLSEKVKLLAHGPSKQVLKYSSYMIDGVTYHTKERDNARVVQNSSVSLCAQTMQVASAKDKNPTTTDMMYYGVIQEIWELIYHDIRVPMFKCDWVENNTGIRVDDNGFTLVNLKRMGFKSDPFILGTQAKQVFYVEDPQDPTWSVVLSTPNREYFEYITDDNLGDPSIHYQCFTKGMPSMDIDETDDNEPPCIRADCDGIWVDNGNS
ncbi:uncharacterized protein LOC141829097 [Curcuma longa]|uniref:uncharacterized protein LOC141829097 n=1 Tax=Curcuma longa TaxID=136217 RepID=UPI003D9F2306